MPRKQSPIPPEEVDVPLGVKRPWYRNILELRFLRRKSVWVFAAVIILVLMFFNSLFVYVRPNEYGIKVVKIGAHRGVQQKVYTAGWHFVMPFGIHRIHRLPRDVQVLELTRFPNTAARMGRTEKAAHIQTSDGFFVDVDVSVLYQLKDPYKVFTLIGPGRLFEDNGIIPKTEPALKSTLGELTTEEFFNSHLRVEKTDAARDLLNAELMGKGIEVKQVLVRYFRYSEEIQRNIEEKKLKDQLVFKNQAERRAATEAAKLKKVVQEGEMAVVVKLAEGKAYVTRRKAEKDLYVRSVQARADLLVQLAEAKRTELRNTALKGRGSDRMVGLKMADALKGLNVVILSSDGAHGVNPLDLRKTLGLFEVRTGGVE